MNKSPAKLFISFLLTAALNTLTVLLMNHFDVSVNVMVGSCTGLCTLWVLYVILFCRRGKRGD